MIGSEIEISTLRHSDMIENASELLALVCGIRGSSSLWNSDYLSYISSQDDYLGYIARNDVGILAGVVILHRVSSINALMLNHPHIFLRRLVVAPKMRLNGLGRLLLQTASKELARTSHFPDVSSVGWQTNIKNKDGTEFFGRLGFHPIGQIRVGETTDNIYSVVRVDFIGRCDERIRK